MMKKSVLGSMKSRFKNLPIQRKMIYALLFCIILPILLLGVLTVRYIVRLSEQNQYEVQISQLIRAGQEIEGLYTGVTREAARLAGDSSVQAIAEGNATGQDYWNAAKSLEESAGSIEYCCNISVSRDGHVVFQRGENYIGEGTGVEGYESFSYWKPAGDLHFQKGIRDITVPVFSYHTAVLNKITILREGMLNVYLRADELLETLAPYDDDTMGNVFLFDREGEVIAAQKGGQEEGFRYWEAFSEEKDRERGYFPISTSAGQEIALYTRCGNSGWYLFQIEKKPGFYSVQLLFIIGAVVLCVLFGMVYGMIQNKTMILPLRRLSERIDVVKTGVLEKQEYETNKDEIGRVEKGFEDMVARVRGLIDQVYVETIKRQDAEREALLAKMNPHFLYNSLDSIHWLAYRNKDYEVSEQLEALADVYRHILRFGENMITVSEELEFIDNYLYLLESQMGERVTFLRDIPEELYGYMVPKLILQPLVENAVQHGLKDVPGGGVVRIRMRRRGERLLLWVLDNGAGCDGRRVMEQIHSRDGGQSFALRNIDERVRLRFGEECGLLIYSKGAGCIVRVALGVVQCQEPAGICRQTTSERQEGAWEPGRPV